MRTTIATIIGFVVWLAVTIGFVILYFLIVDWSPDSKIAIAICSFIGSSMGAGLALEAAKRIRPEIKIRNFHVALMLFVLVWMGSAVVSAPNEATGTARIFSLIAALLGIFSSWNLSRRDT